MNPTNPSPTLAHCASDQTEFETIDEVWNALTEARKEIARLRNRLGEHDGCSRWGVKDAIALKPNAQPPEPTTACTCSESNEEHTCPFQEDVHNDSETLCRCCPVCIQRCADDI